jgi:hypothetical protein
MSICLFYSSSEVEKTALVFAYGNGRKTAAVIVKNDKIDAVAVKKVSDEDASLIEFSCKGLKFYGANLYFAIDRYMGRNIRKVEEIRKLTRGKSLIIFLHSNSHSKLWHDTQTNQRGKNLEVYITSDLFFMRRKVSPPSKQSGVAAGLTL